MTKVHNALGENTTDLYETPISALKFLTSNFRLPPGVIWEPACGKGAIVKQLEKEGFKVKGTSLELGQDFLTYNPTFKFSSIVTNPPFSLKNEFIEICAGYGKPFALLMPIAALEGKARQKIWKSLRLTMLMPPSRIRFDRFDGLPAAPNMASAWFIGEPGKSGSEIKFVE